MMIDVDDKHPVHAVDAGPCRAVALQDDRRIIAAGHDRAYLPDGPDAGERTVHRRDGIRQGHVDLLAHLFKDAAHRQHGADCIAVRAGVGHDKEAIAYAERLEDVLLACCPHASFKA